MKTGIELIAEERAGQILVEGWTEANDDKYHNRELARAASTYLMHYIRSWWLGPKNFKKVDRGCLADFCWPFAVKRFRPTESAIRALTKAGALIAAEIDRIQRLPTQPAKEAGK